MKRAKFILTTAMICIAALCATLLVGCQRAKLDTPNGFDYSDGTFSWNAVKNASGYKVAVNKKAEFYITDTSIAYDDSKLKGGLINEQVNTLCVVAVAVDEEGNVTNKSDIAQYEFDYVTPVQTNWTVTLDFNYNGAPQAQTTTVKSGGKLDKPDNPTRKGWTFDGWYRDKLCLVAADFTAVGVSNFNITADTTLYAKWSLDKTVTYTSVYFYSESWTDINVKPYKNAAELFDGDGISMAAVAGKANWFKANIDDTATSVIFTNGEESTQSAAFDKNKPYCKNGAWTASMPVDQPVGPVTHVVSIKVNNADSQQLTANPDVDGEYIIELTLQIGDKVVITMDGAAVSNYSPDCNFTGTVTVEGAHTFYVSTDKIWVDVPKAPCQAFIVINGQTDDAVSMEENNSTREDVEIEYCVTVELKAGDTVKIFDGSFEFTKYENAFNGTAPADGSYTFYAKKYVASAERDPDVWVAMPDYEKPVKIYFYNANGSNKLTTPHAYCWNSTGNAGGWPGEEMDDLGNGWYVIDIDEGYENIIFSDGKQTKDLPLVVTDGVAYYDFNGLTDLRPAE